MLNIGEKMNKNDRKLLIELLENGRATLSKLAENVGLTRQTVKRKIEKLKKKGIIEGFTIKLFEEKLSLKERAYIIIKAKPESNLREKISSEMKDLEEVSQFHYLFGRFDGIIEIITQSEKRLHEIIERIHQFEVVEDTETLIVHETVKKDQTSPIKKVLRKNF